MATQTIQLTGSAITGIESNESNHRLMMAPLLAQLPTTVALGRMRPQAMPQALQLNRYLDRTKLSITLPPSINRRDKAAASTARMYLNDRLGCCVISGKAHLLGVMSANDTDSGGIILASDAEINEQYVGICGPGDNGCNITQVLNVMKVKGFKAGGKYYKIDGYVAADWTNTDETKIVQIIFGATSIGINLPSAWTSNAIWDVTNTSIVGGHDVTPVDYDEQGVYVMSWGRIYLITWAAWKSRKWLEEYWAILSQAWYGNDLLAPCGLDATTLRDDLTKIGNGILPDIGPPAPPGPPLDQQTIHLNRNCVKGTYENGTIILASDMAAGDYVLFSNDPSPPIPKLSME